MKKCKRLISKNIIVNNEYTPSLSILSLDELWKLHEIGRHIYESAPIVGNSRDRSLHASSGIKRFGVKKAIGWIDIKLELAKRIMKKCTFCFHKCGANRINNEKGLCLVGKNSFISAEYIHLGEEKEIIPAHTIFFTGCTFHCVYCQNWKGAFRQTNEHFYSQGKLVEIITQRFNEGAKTVNFTGGTPEPHLLTILKIVKYLPDNITPLFVFNSNASLSEDGLKLMEGIIDIYVPDFKYGNDNCALRYSGINNYLKTVTENILFMYNTAKVLVRHLILPEHIECCTKPVLDWIKKNIPDITFNPMFQYRPCYKAWNYIEIARMLNENEIKFLNKLLKI